ncbi:hypothetical protein NL108_011276 [Boleophthalmus pectinirostris]|nr:hypothetical protein NL108_011276 [Boleophthalmus pectinirostris]
MLSAANIFRHGKHTGLSSSPTVVTVKPSATYASSYFLVLAFGRFSFVSLSPPLSACLLIPVKYFFMVSLEGLLHFVSTLHTQTLCCVQSAHAQCKQNSYTTERMLPAPCPCAHSANESATAP